MSGMSALRRLREILIEEARIARHHAYLQADLGYCETDTADAIRAAISGLCESLAGSLEDLPSEWRPATEPPSYGKIVLADNGRRSGAAVCRRMSDHVLTPSAIDGPLWYWSEDLREPMRPQPIAWCEFPRFIDERNKADT
jgi:hypothetical protein